MAMTTPIRMERWSVLRSGTVFLVELMLLGECVSAIVSRTVASGGDNFKKADGRFIPKTGEWEKAADPEEEEGTGAAWWLG